MKELTRRIRSINARITVVQRIYGKESSIYKRVEKLIKLAGGNTRFSSKMFEGGLRQIAKAYNTLETIENNPYLSKKGREEIGNKARSTFAANHSEFDSSTLEKMFDVFSNSSFNKLSEIFEGYSDVLVDEIMNALEENGDISSKEISNYIDNFIHELGSYTDNGDAIENFIQGLF